MLNKLTRSAEPNRVLVECAITEVLQIAQRQGLTPADFVRLLDSGMPISDLLIAFLEMSHRRLGRYIGSVRTRGFTYFPAICGY
jgi:hypothetical protein